MNKYYIISITKLIDTFSKIPAGKKFDLTLSSSESSLTDSNISKGDILLVHIEDETFYQYKVINRTESEIQLEKIFEIKKEIGYTVVKNNIIHELTPQEYNNICQKLFSSYVYSSSINTEINNEEKLNAQIIYAYLKQNKSHRVIEEELLDIKNNGYAAMEKLHHFDIDGAKKNILNTNKFETEWKNSTIKYRKSLELLLKYYDQEFESPKVDFSFKNFQESCADSGLVYTDTLITRFIGSLITKPFVLLTGLSGSGKTKLAQSFAQWICADSSQYKIVPVGADWNNREPLLGYENALNPNEYVLPENGALQLIMEANKKENEYKPYFLILDEMNLSHVERYFADFLSVMESKEMFSLHSSDEPLTDKNGIGINKTYSWPKNLFVVGTVNIDETTYMFSPKVLDRANVIEFRISDNEMESFLTSTKEVKDLNNEGSAMAANFIEMATEKSKDNPEVLQKTLIDFFKHLQPIGAEFGYRTAAEIQTLCAQINKINAKYEDETNQKIDFAIMQKLLPKLHGSRNKLSGVLQTLAVLCYEDFAVNPDNKKLVFEGKPIENNVRYPISLEKITRMYNNVIANGFTSYAEA